MQFCKQGRVGAERSWSTPCSSGNLSQSSYEIAADKSLWFTRDHLVSSAHEEIRDEGEEWGIETVDRREARQEGKRHAWKRTDHLFFFFLTCHINHLTYRKTVLSTGANAAVTSRSQSVL